MHLLAVGFWGAFYGTVGLMLAGGLLATTGGAGASAALVKVRDMSRTAWSFSIRAARHDHGADVIGEMPLLEGVR